jgi:hypothetical protein
MKLIVQVYVIYHKIYVATARFLCQVLPADSFSNSISDVSHQKEYKHCYQRTDGHQCLAGS